MHSNNARPRSWPAVLVLAVLAPVCAEYSSGYLPNTGDPVALVATLVVFAPLYGGAALLVREGAVRTRHGWTGVLLLAMVFGVVEAALIDLSLFTTERHDISSWQQIIGPTMIDPLGVSAGAAVTWVGGHVLMSIGVPIAVTEALFPRLRGRSWLPWPVLGVVAVVFAGVAVVVHVHEQRAYGATLTPARVLVVLSLCAALVAAARSRRTRPRPDRDGGLPRAWLLVLTGALTMLGVDCATAGWVWAAGSVAVCAGVAWWLVRRGRRASFVGRGAALLAVGALVERALIAFTAPVPDQVAEAAKFAHNVGFLALVVALGLVVVRRDRALGSGHDRSRTTG